MNDAIKPQPGNASDPNKFVGRALTTARALEQLRSGMNLLLNDPRRMGKTYWLTHLKAEATDFETIIIDYEGTSSVEDVLTKTISALMKTSGAWLKIKERVSGYLEGVELGSGPVKVKVAAQHQSRLKMLEDVLTGLGSHADKPVLICMDELPLALRNIARRSPEEAAELLQLLRGLRAEVPNVRWVLAGSIGFHHVLRSCGATEGELNNLESIHLGPLNKEDSSELTRRLGLGIAREFNASATSRVFQRTDGIPYLVHELAKLLDTGSTSPVTVTEIDTAIEDYIDDPDESRAYAHILTRVDVNFSKEDAPIARRVLDSIARANNAWLAASVLELEPANGELPVGQLHRVLELLVSDHYLQKRGTSYRWRYAALRYFWVRRRNLEDRP